MPLNAVRISSVKTRLTARSRGSAKKKERIGSTRVCASTDQGLISGLERIRPCMRCSRSRACRKWSVASANAPNPTLRVRVGGGKKGEGGGENIAGSSFLEFLFPMTSVRPHFFFFHSTALVPDVSFGFCANHLPILSPVDEKRGRKEEIKRLSFLLRPSCDLVE